MHPVLIKGTKMEYFMEEILNLSKNYVKYNMF